MTGAGRSAYIGLGFDERSDAFDFSAALQEHNKPQDTLDFGPSEDLSLKEGETIRIKVPKTASAAPAAAPAAAAAPVRFLDGRSSVLYLLTRCGDLLQRHASGLSRARCLCYRASSRACTVPVIVLVWQASGRFWWAMFPHVSSRGPPTHVCVAMVITGVKWRGPCCRVCGGGTCGLCVCYCRFVVTSVCLCWVVTGRLSAQWGADFALFSGNTYIVCG